MLTLKIILKYLAYIFAALILIAAVLITVINVAPELALNGISKSHIDANVPNKSDFDTFLKRDLKTYFSQRLGKEATVEYELLLDGPTQSGTAYPKYYIWVTVKSDGAELQGAARVAAMDQETFSVTDFVSKEDIVSRPSILEQNFPTSGDPKNHQSS